MVECPEFESLIEENESWNLFRGVSSPERLLIYLGIQAKTL